MPNGIKYDTMTYYRSGCLKTGDMFIGNGTAEYGLTFYTGITPSGASGYTIYQNKASNGPSIYCVSDDAGLIEITNYQVAGSAESPAGYTTTEECLLYYAGQSDKFCVNRDYEGIVIGEPGDQGTSPAGLVSLYDAGFTPSYPRTGNSVYDLSGNPNTGSLSVGVGYSYSVGEGSFVFDGDNKTDISLPSGFSNINFTVGAWFYLEDPTGYDNLILSDYAQTSFRLATNQTGYLQAGYTSPWDTVSSPTPLNANTWYYGVVTFNNADGWKLYLNSINVDSDADTNGPGDTSSTKMGISLLGKVAITHFYNRVLSATEINQNWDAQKVRFGL